MSTYTGDDLCVRLCGALGVGISGYTIDPTNFPNLVPPGYPSGTLSMGAWYFYSQMRQFEEYGRVPQWHRVICGVTIPDFSADVPGLVTLATAAGFNVGGLPNDFATVGNAILAQAGSPWDQPPNLP